MSRAQSFIGCISYIDGVSLGFLDRFFGRMEPVPDTTAILLLPEFLDFLDKREAVEFSALMKRVSPRLNEIQTVQEELSRQLDDFRKRNLELEEGHTRLRKIVESSKRGFLLAMDTVLAKTKVPDLENFEAVKAFAADSLALLEREVVSFGKNIVYTGLVMRRELKDFGKALQEFQSLLVDLNGLVAKSALNQVSRCRAGLKDLQALLAERGSLTEKAAALEAQLAELRQKTDDTSQELSLLRASPELVEWEKLVGQRDELLARQRDLKNRLVGLLAFVDKQLRRFLKRVQAGHYGLDPRQAKILGLYLENPFDAIREDPEARELKRLLLQLRPLLEAEDIGVKDDRERERKLATLNELIAHDFFTEIFSKFNALEAELFALGQRLSGMKLGDQIIAREKWLHGLEGLKASAAEELSMVRARLTENEEQVMQCKGQIETLVLAALRSRVILKVDL